MAEQNFAVLTPTESVDVIYETLMADETARDRVMLMGRHGVGKSTVMRDVVAKMDEFFEGGAELIDVRCLQLDLGSFRGLERIIKGDDGEVITIPARPYFLPKYEPNVTAKTRRYVIFLDELMAADDAIRKAAFEILTDHRSGPHLLGTNVYVVGAGNAAEEGTNVHELDWATRDRFTFIRLEPSHAGVIERFTAKGVHYHMLAFVRNNPGFLEASAADYENNNLAAPSPRSLESASNTLWAHARGKIKTLTRDVGLKGKLGMAAAGILIAAIEDEDARFDLMKLVAAKPEEREYPRNTFGVFSLAGALAAYAEDPEKLDTAIDVMIGMPEDVVDCSDEVKTVFIQIIGEKLTQWRLIFKYALDPRVRPFLTDSEEILIEADRQHAARLAAEEAEGRQAA